MSTDRAPAFAARRNLRSRLAILALACVMVLAVREGPLASTYDLTIADTPINITGETRTATTINGTVPGPALRWQEGETVTLNVTNRLAEMTSIHWHGILLPADMDGVPGLSFDGIAPGETFTYQFTLKQSGTYWYHSHSGLQEQSGVYGSIVIEPAALDPNRADRDYVVVLSDWTDEDLDAVFAKLKKRSDYYNLNKRTVGDFFRDVSADGWRATVDERLAWGRMRMDPTDIADITGYTYAFLINGRPPEANWTALFTPGERVRLRFINSAAMTYYDVRIPGLSMTVVQADGQDVEPVPVDEIRIAVAETYDVIVEPEERAYTIFAEAMDRSGYARATLAPREGMTAPIPELRSPVVRTMADMGMDRGDMMGMNDDAGEQEAMSDMGVEHEDMAEQDDAAMMGMSDDAEGQDAMAGMDGGDMDNQENGAMVMSMHGPDDHGPANAMVAMMPTNRLDDPGVGLSGTDRRVLVYTDLRARTPSYDRRQPEREIELHLTGNMERYVWSFNGKKFSEAEPIRLQFGERVRFILVNDTMMAHPIHLHGMWSELVNGAGAHKPRKHTINVKPGERLAFDVTADALGAWAFHCHLLYHMEAGMFRAVVVARDVADISR